LKKSFYILGEIKKETTDQFKAFLKTVSKNEPIYMRIKSWGGNSGEGRFIEGFIYVMKKYNGSSFIMEGEIAASTALRIFIRGNERIITKDSIIQPHLPVPNTSGISSEKIAFEREIDLNLITKTIPALTKEDIMEYDNLPFPITFMKRKGVVTKIVSSF
jgi:ATP-dependent protease ClpP protease subunit